MTSWMVGVAASTGCACPFDKLPRACPHALGINIESIRWDGDGLGHPYREWRPVCVDSPASLCGFITGTDELESA